jgi:hypothetical protein
MTKRSKPSANPSRRAVIKRGAAVVGAGLVTTVVARDARAAGSCGGGGSSNSGGSGNTGGGGGGGGRGRGRGGR